MNKKLIVLLLAGLIVSIAMSSYAQEEGAMEQVQIIREAKEANKNLVAVDGYLIGEDIFELTVIARMKREKPRIHNVIVVGPGLGRLSCETKEILIATTKELDPFLTKKKDKGFINFGEDEEKSSKIISKSNVSKGRLSKALYRFVIPRDKIKKDKKYKLWVQILSSQRGSKYKTYKFDLENFAQLVLSR